MRGGHSDLVPLVGHHRPGPYALDGHPVDQQTLVLQHRKQEKKKRLKIQD